MGLFFGTDGLRGIVNEDLTFEVAYKCGNALSILKDCPKILIGRDTRVTGEYLTAAVGGGAAAGGANVIDLGIIPTAGVAYLTRELKADYGVVISASHNPKEYNGIKVFNSAGYKMSDKEEAEIERCFIRSKIVKFPHIGRLTQDFSLIKLYENFIINNCSSDLDGLSVVLDGANGAASRVAPQIFRKLGANVVATNCFVDGMKINDNCGATCPETLVAKMKRYGADVGFSFDGDADRLIAVTSDGKIVDGDMILYVIARYLQKNGKLKNNAVVGTSHTNMAIEKALAESGISLIRADVGDKYVLQILRAKGLSVGGEQSGHIILKDVHTTGDGILSAVCLSDILVKGRASLSELADVKLFPQTTISPTVENKHKIINHRALAAAVERAEEELKNIGRITVRASGTEPKIRVMVESEDSDRNNKIANRLVDLIKEIDME